MRLTYEHDLIKEKLKDLIEWAFQREVSPFLVRNERNTNGYKR